MYLCYRAVTPTKLSLCNPKLSHSEPACPFPNLTYPLLNTRVRSAQRPPKLDLANRSVVARLIPWY